MDIEILGLTGFALVATALARMSYEHRLDVLYGPYIEGRVGACRSLIRRRKSADPAVDRLELLRENQLASIAS